MGDKMVINLKKKIEVKKIDNKLELPQDIRSKIDIFWKEQVEKNPHLFNGEVWSVTKLEELENEIKLWIQKTDYAHYLFDERVGLEGENACYNLNSGILLETKDGYYIIGEMNEITSYPNGLQISGGSLDQNDIMADGKVDIVNNIARELKEELNIDLFDKKIVKEYRLKYLEIPEGRRHAYTPMMKGVLNITSAQMEEMYNNYEKFLENNNEDIEFKKLHFIKKDNAIKTLRELTNQKRPYLEKLIELDSAERDR